MKDWRLYSHSECSYLYSFHLEYLLDLNLRYVRIYFDTTSFMRLTKYKSTTFEDKLSAIGGTMGLLTGCSIISWVEIIFFGIKFIVNWVIKFWLKEELFMNQNNLYIFVYSCLRPWINLDLHILEISWDIRYSTVQSNFTTWLMFQ